MTTCCKKPHNGMNSDLLYVYFWTGNGGSYYGISILILFDVQVTVHRDKFLQ